MLMSGDNTDSQNNNEEFLDANVSETIQDMDDDLLD